ncbi:MAG: Macrolide export ATP-binding/permease protein MacB [Syntrophaceae bacterium PtaU1.Bin231]|nr:MAG: Macrolide export ATP-binding/permease protein MacB [Syntrophaceae bacterium PtaU1.Bin231]HOG17297.1 ABC transporter permease [Syntrophales bacterium]
MKRLALNLRIALRSLANFRLRTALAVLGVFFGTFSLIIVLNLSDSMAEKTEQETESLGKNLLIVRSGFARRYGANVQFMTTATNLTVEDARAVADGIPYVTGVCPTGYKNFPVRYEGTVLNSILVTGVPPNYEDIRNFRVQEGRFVTDEDSRNLRKVVVIGSGIAEKLFGEADPLGRTIMIWRVPCEVIGVMEAKGVDLSGVDQDNQLFVPLQTFLKNFVNREYVNTFYVQTVDTASLKPAKEAIEDLLRKRHRIAKGTRDDFAVIDLKDVMALKSKAMDLISILGKIAAAASFLIGGLGILSIMILIVSERRMEIGVRRAVGSRKRDIVFQFLMESAFISVSGGMIGVAAGVAVSLAVAAVLHYPARISLAGLTLSFLLSIASGVLAGLYPSVRATKIHPVDVLRS